MLSTLIEELRSSGVLLSVNEGRLICSAPTGSITPELSARIREAKTELLEMLTGAEQSIVLANPIERAADQKTYPLSGSQRRSIMTAHPKAILPSAFRLSGPLEVKLLCDTLNYFVERHAPLRTRFNLIGSHPIQTVMDYKRFEIQTSKASEEPGRTLKETLERLQNTGVDPQQGICYRFEILQTSSEEHVLFAAFSPFIFDGWSFDLFWRELTEGYAALATGNAWPFTALAFSYADCTSWLTDRIKYRAEELQHFWRDQLGDELPLDVFPLAGRPTSNQRTLSIPFNLDPILTGLVREFSIKAGVSPQVVLLSATYVWSYGLRGVVDPKPDEPSELDVILGIAVEGRPHVALENVVGSFANLILLREHISQNSSFMVLAKRVQDDLLKAHQHQEFPMDLHQIRSRAGSTRSFQIEFSFQQTSGRSEYMGPLRIEQIELHSGTSAVDLSFWVKDWGERIAGAVEFRAGSFEEETMEQWIECYYYLLANMLKAHSIPISQHELLPQKKVACTVKAPAGENSTIFDERKHLLPFGVPGRIHGRDEIFYLSPNFGLKLHTSQHAMTQEGDAYYWPQTDTEVQLEILLQNILGQRIGVQVNFFEAGLNSLLALHFIVQCQANLGIPISIPVLFENPSISELATYLDRRHYELNARKLVPLQPKGDQPPLYCICGINLYRQLAVSLGEKQLCFAIYVPQEREFLAETFHSTAELAQLYWDTIREQHVGNKLRLLGFCYGGALAYEIALLARAEGLNVEQLILIDTALSKRMTRRPRARIVQWFPKPMRQKIKYLLGITLTADGKEPASNTVNKNVLEALSTRLDEFNPGDQYDGVTIMVDSGDIEMYASWKKTAQTGWEGVLTGAVHYIRLNTLHSTVLEKPNVEKIAADLRTIFSDTGA